MAGTPVWAGADPRSLGSGGETGRRTVRAHDDGIGPGAVVDAAPADRRRGLAGADAARPFADRGAGHRDRHGAVAGDRRAKLDDARPARPVRAAWRHGL